MKTLYIIGNGFDLYHGLPTSYSDFYHFAEELLDDISEYYHVNCYGVKLWSGFEEVLGEYYFEAFRGELPDTMREDFKYRELNGTYDEVVERADNYVEELKDSFQRWVEQINIGIAERKILLAEDSRFITFNYTSTLQAIYGISDKDVLHIHGSAAKFDDLIFGHGKTMAEEPEFDENGDVTHTIFSDIDATAKYPFYALKKPVDEILDKYKDYFNSLKDILEVIILGHSINAIDWPYFKAISKNAPNANWTYCLPDNETQEEKNIYLSRLCSCGILRDRIKFVRYVLLALPA